MSRASTRKLFANLLLIVFIILEAITLIAVIAMAAMEYNYGPMDVSESDKLVIEESLVDLTTQESGDVVFECKVVCEGNPRPQCVWYKDGKVIENDQRFIITTEREWHRLEISKVTLNDNGLYSIICSNNGKKVSSKAMLLVAPKIIGDALLYKRNYGYQFHVAKHIRDIQVKVGQTIELEAEFYRPIDECFWYKNHELVKENNRMIILKSQKASLLTIVDSEVNDTGVYTVIVKNNQEFVSSVGSVQVFDDETNMENDSIPFIEELLPDEMTVNEGEELRLTCKVILNETSSIIWHKNNSPVDPALYIPEEYGNHYIGLRIVRTDESDSSDFSVVVVDEETGKEDSCKCYVTVNDLPPAVPVLPIEVKKHLDNVLAVCGSKLTFDCSFALDDSMYFYVVWYVGRYRVERSNSQFDVICMGVDFLLYIKSLDPGMAGEVTCELRRALPNQRSAFVNKTIGNITIVPPCVIKQEKDNPIALKSKIFDDNNDGVQVNDMPNSLCSSLNDFPIARSMRNFATDNYFKHENIFDIVFCRLEQNGLYFMQAERGSTNIIVTRLKAFDKSNGDLQIHEKTMIIEWDDSIIPFNTWYSIGIVQSDGTSVEAGRTSSPQFELQDPPLGKLLKFRVKTARPIAGCADLRVCIVPSSEPARAAMENIELKSYEEFDMKYIKTPDEIGQGAFGIVNLVRDEGGNLFAAKIVKTRTQKKRALAMREFEIMTKLDHPKLVRLVDAFVARDSFVLVMEYLWGGELFDRIVDEENFKEADVIPYVRQICEALEYLHSKSIVHLDLKPENIICISPNSGQVKVIDFGLARVLTENHTTRAIYGTRDYVAPEVLNYERLTLACDMWSLGVVTYMLLSGVMPFAGDTWPKRSANITLANYNYDEVAFREISDLAKDFVDKLLLLSPEKRMNVKDALNHKWITEGPLTKSRAGQMKKTRENLKSYLANNKARWQNNLERNLGWS